MRKLLFAAITGALTLAALPVDAEACINGMEKHRKPTEKPTFLVDVGLDDKPELSASINETALVSALGAQASALQSCLTNHRVRLTHGAKEKVTLSLVVAPSGTVTESNVLASSYHGQDFQACVDSAAKNTDFGSLRSGKSEKIYITIGFQAFEVIGGHPGVVGRPQTGSAGPVDSPSRGTSAPATPKTSPNES